MQYKDSHLKEKEEIWDEEAALCSGRGPIYLRMHVEHFLWSIWKTLGRAKPVRFDYSTQYKLRTEWNNELPEQAFPRLSLIPNLTTIVD